MKILYLAGPMRGYEQFNFPAFHEAAERLRGNGYDVMSPAEHDLKTGFDPASGSLDGFDLCAAMRWDIQAVLLADAVAVLAGWEKSEGCAIETAVALAIGIPVLDARTLERLDVPERAGRAGDSQPMPTPNAHADIQSLVMVDIEARRQLGIRRYGTALQPHNGRRALLDAYEEVLDLSMYLKQHLVEEDEKP